MLFKQLQFIKQHLQKSKEGSKYGDGKQRSSPVPGNHSALSMTAPPALCLQQTKTIHLSARHSPRQNMNRYQRNSVEGLNTVSLHIFAHWCSRSSPSCSLPNGCHHQSFESLGVTGISLHKKILRSLCLPLH